MIKVSGVWGTMDCSVFLLVSLLVSLLLLWRCKKFHVIFFIVMVVLSRCFYLFPSETVPVGGALASYDPRYQLFVCSSGLLCFSQNARFSLPVSCLRQPSPRVYLFMDGDFFVLLLLAGCD